MPFFNILVPTEDTIKFKTVIDYLMRGGFNIAVSGETGPGKSVIIQQYLGELDEELFVSNVVNFSA